MNFISEFLCSSGCRCCYLVSALSLLQVDDDDACFPLQNGIFRSMVWHFPHDVVQRCRRIDLIFSTVLNLFWVFRL